MRIVLARRHEVASLFSEPSEVHAYQVPDDSPDVIWLAPCGAKIEPDQAELVPAFTGVPCERCWMLATLASDAPPVARGERENMPRGQTIDGAQRRELANVTTSANGLSVSWRARVVHYVDPTAPRTELDGATLVLGLCGRLGWGPIENTPEHWDVCPDCQSLMTSNP